MTDDFKKRLKEIAEKVSDSQSAQSIATTQTPKISTSISTNTKTTNKSGRIKSAPIKKEPKREKLSWSDEDSRDGWNDRLFLEGFYEVDSTVNDWEREKRMSQVERSLKEIEKRKRKAENPPGVILSGGQRPNLNAVRASFGRDLTGQSGTFTGLPGTPNAPAQITKLPYYGGRYPAYTNYANAANKNTAASKSGDTTRPPTQEELEAAYADMQKGFSGQNALQHINDAAEYVTNAATPQNNTQRKTQTATTTSTAQTQSRDARVRENYRARQQAETDARYEDFDIEAAEAKLRDNAYWTERLLESRRQGNGFAGDEQIAEERNVLEQEIKSAKDAADRRRERYIREKAAQMPDNGLHELLRWSVRNMPERKQDTFSVSPQFSNTLYPEISPGYSNGSIPQKNYYTKNKSIYGENTDKALDAISNILTATSLVPGIDTFADAAAIPVDLLRGDYISAGLDAFGILPFVGEVADTAKLARAGMKVADKAHDAGKVIDAVKIAHKADDVADVLKTENNVGELAKPYPKENLPKEVAEWIRKLPQYKDAIEISSTPSYEQISLLSRQEGVEFASITIGNRNIIIRGDTSGTPISQDLLEDMIRNKGVLNCHSHPYIGDFRPSESDLYIAHILSHQEEFEIITPDNMRAVYTKHGIKSVGNIERKLSEQDVLELYKLFGG